MSHFLFDAEEHLLTDSSLEFESLVVGDRLPVLNPASFDGLGLTTGGEDDARGEVFGVDPSVGGDRLDAGGPDAVFVTGEPGHPPAHLGSDAADLIEDGGRSWARGDQDVVR